METMKKLFGKLLFRAVLCLALSVGFSNIQAEAAPKLNKKNVTITVGKTVKLKVKGTKKKVKWSSSKKSVCTVSKSGVVKAKKAGQATIKAKVAKKTLKCQVKVKAKKVPAPAPAPAPAAVKPTGITVTGALSKIAPGGTLQLQMGFVPANATPEAVKWSTSHSGRATVSNTGLVVAKSTGEVTITAELESNWRIKGTYKLNIENLVVDGEVTTADGGDLLLSEDVSKAVYNYTLSYTAANVVTQVVDGVGNVIRSYPMGTMSPETQGSVIWDLKDTNGNKVSPGSYCFQVVAAGTTIKSDFFMVYAKSEFGVGNGSPAFPYEISTLEQLQQVWKHNGVCFKQTANIDAGLTGITPLFTADVPFEGTYDGGGFSIMNVSNMTNSNNIGIFSAIGKNGKVENLTIENSYFNGKNEVAAIAAINNGSVTNCSVKKCSLRGSEGRAGTIVSANYGTILNCRTQENTLSTANGHIGGICAYNKGTVIESVINSDNLAISGNNWELSGGGVVGWNDGNIIKCTVTSVDISVPQWNDRRSGGIAGYNSGTIAECIVENCTLGDAPYKGGIIGYNDGNNTSNHYNGSDYNQTGN